MFSVRMTRRGPALSEVADRLQRSMPVVTKENKDDLVDTAKRHVHKRTRKTEESLEARMDTPTSGRLRGKFGASWEVKRGGEHDFAAAAIEEVKPRALARVHKAVEDARR